MAKPKRNAVVPVPADSAPASDFWHFAVPAALLLLSTILVGFARIRLLAAPLERDEGEYAYMGQLMLRGIPPYSVAANMKFPGVSAVYALFMAVFGESISAVHISLLVCNIATAVLLYFLARRFFTAPAAIAAATAFVVLSSGWSVMGMWAHATHFVILPAVAGTLMLLQWNGNRQPLTLLFGGFCFGLSILMKQHGVFFVVFALAARG